MRVKTGVTINGWTEIGRGSPNNQLRAIALRNKNGIEEVVGVPEMAKIKKGSIIDNGFPLPRFVTLPDYRMANRPVTNEQFKSFLHFTGKENRLESLLLETLAKNKPGFRHQYIPENGRLEWLLSEAPQRRDDLNEFWALPSPMSWHEAADYCDFLNEITRTDIGPAWNYTIPSRAQWIHAFRNSEELVTFKDKSGNLLYEWTSDLSGRIEYPPDFEGKLKPLPMTTMRYNSELDKSRSIEYASWLPDWDFSIVFRPVQERIAVTD